MPLDVILAAGIPVWVGPPHRTQKRLVAVGRLKERFPALADLKAHLGMPVERWDHSVTWDAILVYRVDAGRPVSVARYDLTPLGHIQGGTDEAVRGGGAGGTVAQADREEAALAPGGPRGDSCAAGGSEGGDPT